MSRILIIYGHPSPESFNAAMAEAAKEAIREAGGDFAVHDPYGDGLDPVLSFRKSADPHTKRYVRDLQEADGYIVIHPDWWGQPPAMLKGYLDLVFQEGVAYQRPPGGGWPPQGLLQGEAALVLNTADAPGEGEPANDPLEGIWRDGVFRPCGVADVRRRVFAPVAGSTPEQRDEWLREVRELAGGYVRENGLVSAAT
ncbi:hypothetical protein AN478_10730 [Thiohalorhabdus denitrificans]|uniref:Putative NADPH-quinone reductase (Modulator of drug activity B) n=1 Tax=Thiohalorhabdus denitrificans TaxID=381306 RepID=A0A0P9C8V2_9GAMM|nr:NAD(P)H-dependent oxidoreductase [Thiohalorhabdus denitrificans]KPV39598.1 hypothetical protein AN478_10730 [Thiohalorhabdus denitrificans]SCX97205.1 Putative NADPH-quinone reductase (modulator of drug activity B) [Thiohalorhabdus denitrificans]